MKQINPIQITDIDEDINPLELSAYRGVCGWVSIEKFPYCH